MFTKISPQTRLILIGLLPIAMAVIAIWIGNIAIVVIAAIVSILIAFAPLS